MLVLRDLFKEKLFFWASTWEDFTSCALFVAVDYKDNASKVVTSLSYIYNPPVYFYSTGIICLTTGIMTTVQFESQVQYTSMMRQNTQDDETKDI